VAGDHTYMRVFLRNEPDTASRAVLVADTMEAVAPDALFKPGKGTGVGLGHAWHTVMKSSIKNGGLRDRAEEAFDNLNALKIGWLLQGRERNQLTKILTYLRGKEDALLILCSSANDAMTHYCN